jgi:hypothetical protein
MIKLLVATMTLAASLPALAELPPLGTAQELEARTLTLPTGNGGTVTMQVCASCPTFRFQTTAATQYFIGNQPVGLAELRAAFAAKPEALVMLEITADRRSVVQLFISAADVGRR